MFHIRIEPSGTLALTTCIFILNIHSYFDFVVLVISNTLTPKLTDKSAFFFPPATHSKKNMLYIGGVEVSGVFTLDLQSLTWKSWIWLQIEVHPKSIVYSRTVQTLLLVDSRLC